LPLACDDISLTEAEALLESDVPAALRAYSHCVAVAVTKQLKEQFDNLMRAMLVEVRSNGGGHAPKGEVSHLTQAMLQEVQLQQQELLDKQREVLDVFRPQGETKLKEVACTPTELFGLAESLSGEDLEPPSRKSRATGRQPLKHFDNVCQSTMIDDDPARVSEKELGSLRELLVTNEECEARDALYASTSTCQALKQFLVTMNRYRFEMCLDTFVGAIILINALVIGLNMHYDSPRFPTWHGHLIWPITNLFTSVIFVCELVIKLKLHGLGGQFCGLDWKMNTFDATIVVADMVDLCATFATAGASADANPIPPALFRLIRLVKLCRLLKVLRSRVFADLLAMVQGILGAFMTLAWSFFLLMVMVYFFALFFHVTLGDLGVPNVSEYFNTPPRAFLTIYRCSFGDCSTGAGVPLFEEVWKDERVVPYVILLCAFGFFFWVGLFNVIAAIFVESTMAAASELTRHRNSQRLGDAELWSRNVATLIRILWQKAQERSEVKMSECLEEVAALDIPCDVVQAAVLTPEACEALVNLDICEDDHAHLADILDPDNGGSLGVLDIMDGLARLRGEPRRSDIISIDLMVRALQTAVSDVHREVRRCSKKVKECSKMLQR
jgi:hypothetical protein